MTSFQSVFSFSSCSFPDICLYIYAFSRSLSRPSRRILPILVTFLTFLSVFIDSLYAYYFLLSLVALSLSFRPIFIQTLYAHYNLRSKQVGTTYSLTIEMERNWVVVSN